MLYACAVRFDVTKNLDNFFLFLGELSYSRLDSAPQGSATKHGDLHHFWTWLWLSHAAMPAGHLSDRLGAWLGDVLADW